MDGIPEDMWTPYKQLFKVVDKCLKDTNEISIIELDICLKKHKQNFSSLLRNPPKNEQSRSQLKSGMTEGVSMPGHNLPMLLSKDLVDESIIISDMFDLDEYLSMELLCTAQRQMPQHPGLTRGSVAILLYYDGRKALVYSLRDIFQATSGITWTTDCSKEITTLISSFTQSLVEDCNILSRIIDLLEALDITEETVLLTKNRAFGSKKHQNQVLELFQEIRLALASAFFNWSAQRGLPKAIVARLISYFSKFKTTEATGNMDDVTMTMLMAFLYSCDTSLLMRQEDNAKVVQNLPVLNEPGFVQNIYEALTVENEKRSNNCIHNFLKFSFGLTLASLRQISQNLQNTLSGVIDHDEHLIDDALSQKVFDFIYYCILEKDIIFETEFFYRRIHLIFTDFIDFMHSKITELRGKADETARTVMNFTKEGLEPPANLDHNFEMLMLCIGKFYGKNQCGLSLCVDYWGPLESATNESKSASRTVSLFKFIRLAGELLPPSLFVSYLKMLGGLSSCERSARNTFNLLKQVSGHSGSATISWEHFFGSLARYYSNLRQEQCPGSDTIYKHRMLNRTINPQEIEGICAVLCVIQAVATNDEIARVAICEHPNWAPIHILLGLLSCSVPINLKAEIVKTLSALARSKDSALQLWNNLEASQIISTIPSTSSYRMCNLEMEIDQNESRIETFPLTLSILDMLYTLVTTVIPKNLGAGLRKPGFDPFATFVIDGIFLKFYNRNYRNASEKWEVGEKCLRILYFLVKNYDVNPQDFSENVEEKSPGFRIMLQIHTKSDLLQLILLIIDETVNKLDEYNKFAGKKSLEACSLHCLNILEIGLSKQDIFLYAHSSSNSCILITGLNKILLDINPRSRRPDHLLNTTKFIMYGSWLPHHALVSVNILNLISHLPHINSHMLDMLTQNNQSSIRHGFVECLEGELHKSDNSKGNDINDQSNVDIELDIKDGIITLMQSCLNQPTPNISHFLLGFDIKKDCQLHQMQKLNVIDSSSNCTKSVVLLLDSHLQTMRSSQTYHSGIERIIEKAYNLLYTLCANQRTSDTILRYLKNCNDFLCRHISAMPFKHIGQSHVLNQMSFLLKCIAIDLKLTANNCQISRFQHLCELLVGFSAESTHDRISMELNHFFEGASDIFNNKPAKETSKMLLCNLIDCLELETKSETHPKWNFFESTLTKRMLQDCEIKTDGGPKLIHIKKLNDILNDELRSVQSSIVAGQRQLILQEIESVLLFALKLNNERSKVFATIKLLEAWGQVTEILFTSAPDLAIPVVTKQDLILEIVQKILSKFVPIHAIYELALLSSGTVLLLLVNLKYCYYQRSLQNTDFSCKDYGFNQLQLDSGKQNSNLTAVKSNALSLKLILRNIFDWIIISEVSSQKLRINLYSSLLNCICIVKGNASMCLDDESGELFVSRLDKSLRKAIKNTAKNEIQKSAEVFQSFGDKLIEIVCHDCISGHDICKISSLSCIDSLLDLDCSTDIINFIANRGYLSHIIDSLLKSDDGLCCVLSNPPENIRSLYVYESKMAMLIRFANSHIGAEILLGENIFGVLSGMKVYDMHPDIKVNNVLSRNQTEDFLPSTDSCYRQILFPALNLCDSVLSTLGPENNSAISQVLQFIVSHCDMVETVLRCASPFMDLGLLQELSGITGLIAQSINQELFVFADQKTNQEFCGNLHRIRRLMLSSFSRFIINETTFKKMLKSENILYEPTEKNKCLHVRYFLEIASNLSLYCRNAITNHIADHRLTDVIFSPHITGPNLRIDNGNVSTKMTQGLDDILNQLKGSVEYYNAQKLLSDNLVRQRTLLPNLNIDTKAQATFLELTHCLNEKRNKLLHCSFITEQCLFLLWSHLDFYMNRSVLSTTKTESADFTTYSGHEWVVCTDYMGMLKKTLINAFNETFTKQMLLTIESQSVSDKGFAEALLRRIKSLIQFV